MATKEDARKAVDEASAPPSTEDELKQWFERPVELDHEKPYNFRGPKISKRAVVRALRESNGLVTLAAKKLKCSRMTIYRYMERYPDLQREIDQIRDSYVDFAEASLLRQIQEKNTTATIFLLKCLGKKRGYIESPNVQVHAHVDGAGNWVDIMKRVAAASGGRIEPTPEEIARVIDVTPSKLIEERSASACGSPEVSEIETEDLTPEVENG